MSSHMGDYHRMVRVEQHLVYATPTTPLVYQHNDDLWRSPRGTVLRIQALALVAITLSFFLVVFGSCRRWSNRWIVQKGFSAIQVLSLSLGTYSIGLMQSSSVKSELYPVWAVSLLTLLGCIDPVSTYIGLDYKGSVLKVIFQLCLYSGYILLMSASTISNLFGNIAIGVLSAITFIKGLHRSLALVLPSIMRNKLRELNEPNECGALECRGQELVVHLPVHPSEEKDFSNSVIMMSGIRSSFNDEKDDDKHKKISSNSIEIVCLGYSLSHLLRRRFLGMNTTSEMEKRRNKFVKRLKNRGGYEKTLKAVEVELAFLYEVFFTSNEFIHYYEAKTSSFWALASFVRICLVGIAAAIPGTMASRYYHHRNSMFYTTGPDASTRVTVVVNTTIADLAITLVILLSLALLQLVQLIGCWTSNWTRVAFACQYTRRNSGKEKISQWLRLKGYEISSRMKWFDWNLWQDKLGQYSAVVAASAKIRREEGCCTPVTIWKRKDQQETCVNNSNEQKVPLLSRVAEIVGLQYIKQAVEDLLWSTDTKGGAGIRLHNDVKTCIAEFLGDKMSSREIIATDLKALFRDNGLDKLLENLPFYTNERPLIMVVDGNNIVASHTFAFAHRVMVWHIVTWYCQVAEQEEKTTSSGGGGDADIDKNRRVAMDLSKYCAYLMVSAPELLPGPSAETKRAFNRVMQQTSRGVIWARGKQGGLAAIVRESEKPYDQAMSDNDAFWTGVHCGKELRSIGRTWSWRWKRLARLWVRTLLYAAPSGDVEAHMQHLSQGGEFITHLWALLYHIGIVDHWTKKQKQLMIKNVERMKATRGDQQTPGSSNITGKSKQ